MQWGIDNALRLDHAHLIAYERGHTRLFVPIAKHFPVKGAVVPHSRSAPTPSSIAEPPLRSAQMWAAMLFARSLPCTLRRINAPFTLHTIGKRSSKLYALESVRSALHSLDRSHILLCGTDGLYRGDGREYAPFPTLAGQLRRFGIRTTTLALMGMERHITPARVLALDPAGALIAIFEIAEVAHTLRALPPTRR